MLVGQRTQRLRGHLPGDALDGQLAAPAGDHLALDSDQVADVDEGLEVGERLLADVGEGEHRLQLGAVALAQSREAELAGVAQEDDPPGDRNVVAGVVVGPERLGVVRRDDLAQRVGARHGDRVGVDPCLDQPVALLPANPHLLGQVVNLRRLRCIVGRLRHGAEANAYADSHASPTAAPTRRGARARGSGVVALEDQSQAVKRERRLESRERLTLRR